ncbi:MAG: DNA replication/repair protein RecF [Hyphomicrobiales bacterium]
MAIGINIAQLTLTDFRNYPSLRIEPERRMVVLAGPNGAGKTNLLEAVSLLSPGRGLRRVPFCELSCHQGGGGWAVAAHTQGPQGEAALGTGWTAGDGEAQRNGTRRVSIDGVVQKSSGALGDYFNVLWLTPAMDRLFSGPASDRRRFIDRLVMAFDPGHGLRVATFERLMRERNRLLERSPHEAAWLDGIEAQMAEVAVAVAAARMQAFEALEGAMSRDEDSCFPWAELHLEGELESRLGNLSAVEVEDQYRTMLRDSRKIDAGAGRTLTGPHRSDLLVTHGPKGVAARDCSTGEQKALLVSTVLAHVRLIKSLDGGAAPVLLLDEIAAHLDADRRAALFGILQDLGGQVWMTGTDTQLFDPLRGVAEFYRVEDGSVGSF